MSANHPFDRLAERIQRVGSTVCAGFDPHLDLLPPDASRSQLVPRCRAFLHDVLESVHDVVAAVKPQIAFFEAMGSEGWTLYHELIAAARRLGVPVIGDIKRADIGSTAAAYARAHLGDEQHSADFVTLNPYLGIDGIQPFLDIGRANGRGVYVLVRTSNPSSSQLQSLSVGETPLYDEVGRLVEEWGAEHRGTCGESDVGAVVGATHPEELASLRRAMPHSGFLVPGYGAQGGGAQDVAGAFHAHGGGALISSSRGILFAYRDRPDGSPAEAARDAALEMNRALRQVRSSG